MPDEYESGDDAALAAYVGTLAGLIGTNSDIPNDMKEKNFPILNKINPLSNLNQADEVLLKKSLEILWYLKEDFSYEDLVRLRMIYIPEISLGRDGFAVRRLTEVNKSINYTERGAPQNQGIFNKLLRRK
jgi:hypothetical protein